MDAQKAISYVHKNGTNLEIVRLRHILYGEVPEASIVNPFLEEQNNGGGFPLRMQEGNPDTVDSTLTALWWLDELGMLRAPASKSLQALLDCPISDWEDSQIAWALDCLHKGGIERNHALVVKLFVKLEMSQRPDCKWDPEDGSGHTASATLAVLKVVKLNNRLTEIPISGSHE